MTRLSPGAAFDHAVLRGLPGLCAAAGNEDASAFRAGFAGLQPVECDALGHMVLLGLERDQDWPAWGWATNHTPWGYKSETSKALCAGTDRAIAAAAVLARSAPPPDLRRKHLTRTAFQLLRTGTAAAQLLDRVHGANQSMPQPLPRVEVDRVVVWCVRQHGGVSHAR